MTPARSTCQPCDVRSREPTRASNLARVAIVCCTAFVLVLAVVAQVSGDRVPTDLLDLAVAPYDPTIYPDRNIADAVASAGGDDAATTRLLDHLTPFAAETVDRAAFEAAAAEIDDPHLDVEGLLGRTPDLLVALVRADSARYMLALHPAGDDAAKVNGLIVNPLPFSNGGPISDVEFVLIAITVLVLVGVGLAHPTGGSRYVAAGLVTGAALAELAPWQIAQDVALVAVPVALVVALTALVDGRVSSSIVGAASIAASFSLLPVTATDPGAVSEPWGHLVSIASFQGDVVGLQQAACIAALLGVAAVWTWLASGVRWAALIGRTAVSWRLAGGHAACLCITGVAVSGLASPAPLDLTASGWMVAAPLAIGLGGLGQIVRRRTDLADVSARVADLGSGHHEDLSTVIGRALDDPSARVLHRRGGGYVDRDGRVADLPDDPRSYTLLSLDGAPVGAVVHDPRVSADPERLRTACDAVTLSLANERLAAEIRGQLVEVRASRQRVLEAEDRARIRLERDLHDGAQQRLTAAMLQLRVVQQQEPDRQVAARLGPIADELQRAIDEIRELARGMRPSALDAGLGAAADDLAERACLPVTVHDHLQRRPDPHLETVAYFVLSEALVNAGRHAAAGHVEIRLGEDHDGDQEVLVLTVDDDGRGIARELEVGPGERPGATGGTGLVGLFDRVDAVGGTLAVRRTDRGTMLEVRLPCAR